MTKRNIKTGLKSTCLKLKKAKNTSAFTELLHSGGTIATKAKAKPKKKSEWKGKLQSPKNSHRDGVTLGLFYGTWHSDLCLAL